ncbi:MAG: alanine racemase [Betaproteobacteria bacterium]|nr:alanine racemase [Betaproteobacteria bacterium]
MRPISATIDLDAIRHNYAVARRRASGAKALAVVKANAYGHGLARAARALSDADGFAVVELDAAVRLREAGHTQRIVLLEGFFEPRELAVIVECKLATVVHSAEQLDMLRELPAGAALDVLLKVNTGMNRLGFQPDRFALALARVKSHASVGAVTLMTHFANADDARGVAWQLETFDRVAGKESLPRSLANSAAILRYPETHAEWVRPGIMLYGCSPFAESIGAQEGLKPAMTLASEIIAVRDLARGDAIGYGGVYTAEAPGRIGVVACGYADGYPRHAPTGTPVLVGDRLTRTLGRVSMDMLCVDLDDLHEARVGTPVVLWGEGNPVENVASAAGTVGYELLCAVMPRVRIVEKA